MSNLKMLRRKKGWTQQELADRAGCTPSTVCNVERGANSAQIGTAILLCKALGCTLNDMFPEGGVKRGKG